MLLGGSQDAWYRVETARSLALTPARYQRQAADRRTPALAAAATPRADIDRLIRELGISDHQAAGTLHGTGCACSLPSRDLRFLRNTTTLPFHRRRSDGELPVVYSRAAACRARGDASGIGIPAEISWGGTSRLLPMPSPRPS
jgi:hypothetical protein